MYDYRISTNPKRRKEAVALVPRAICLQTFVWIEIFKRSPFYRSTGSTYVQAMARVWWMWYIHGGIHTAVQQWYIHGGTHSAAVGKAN